MQNEISVRYPVKAIRIQVIAEDRTYYVFKCTDRQRKTSHKNQDFHLNFLEELRKDVREKIPNFPHYLIFFRN